LSEHLEPDSDRFVQFLKKSLARFTGSAKKVDIWCAIDPAALKIKHITIPEMPFKKIGNAAFWGLKREADFDESREIFDFEVLENIVVEGVKKKKIVAFSGAKDHIRSLEDTFVRAGYPLAGITAIPFALQNFIRTGQMTLDAPYFAITHISQESSEIFCFSRSGILLVRSLRTGALNLMEELDENPEMAQLFLPGQEPESPLAQSSQIQEMSERLVSKIIRTGDYCAQHYTGNTPITHYYFLGETDEFAPFMTMAQNMVPGGVRLLDPVPDTDTGIDRPDLPQKTKARNAVLIAFGIALSGNGITPNFLFTDQDKAQKRIDKRITLAVCLAGCLLLMACAAAHLVFTTAHKRDLAILARLDQEATRIGRDISVADIEQAIKNSEKNISQTGAYFERYRPLAVIFDLCRITPPHIRLTSLAYGVADNIKSGARTIRIQGNVTGPVLTLEAELANYMMTLSTSPVFGNIAVTKQYTDVGKSLNQLLFTATLEVF
jgi:Tfp pilus assembly PilM family ATPase